MIECESILACPYRRTLLLDHRISDSGHHSSAHAQPPSDLRFQQFSFWLLELGNSRFEASLPHKCGVPKLAGTPHLCGRAPKMRIAVPAAGRFGRILESRVFISHPDF